MLIALHDVDYPGLVLLLQHLAHHVHEAARCRNWHSIDSDWHVAPTLTSVEMLSPI